MEEDIRKTLGRKKGDRRGEEGSVAQQDADFADGNRTSK